MLFVCVNSLLAKLINCSSVRVCSITSSFSLYIAYILFLFLVFFTSQLCMCVVIKHVARLARAGFLAHMLHDYSPCSSAYDACPSCPRSTPWRTRSLISDHLPSLTACTPERLEYVRYPHHVALCFHKD